MSTLQNSQPRTQETRNWSNREQAVVDVVDAQKGNIVSSGRFALPSDIVRVNCVNNHTWNVTVADLLKGKWCARCATSREKCERSFQTLSAKVEKLGAVVVTDVESYQGIHSFVSLRCSKGHEWKIKASTVLFQQAGGSKETFCHVCSPRRNAKKSLEDLKEAARSKGGECLADFYPNSIVKLPWRCAEGHEWMSTAQNVLGGSWCPTCGLAQRTHNMDDLRSFAKERGGKCLSAEYDAVNTVYKWECAEGHEFDLSFYYARKGAWCPSCIDNKEAERRLGELRALAKERGGECLSERYIRNDVDLLWRCTKGHEWKARPSNICNGGWCRLCSIEKRRGSLEELQQIATERGGECLSSDYKDQKTKLRFRCGAGHEWDATPCAIKRGTWCPACAGTQKKTVEEMVEIARSHGGKFLSSAYLGMHKPHLWQCEKGHEWRARPVNVVAQNSWCPICARGSHTFRELCGIARQKGGEILSAPSEFQNGNSLLRVKCKEGHGWFIRGNALANGSWCRQCNANKLRVSIDVIRQYAESRGGELLTEKISTAKGKPWVFFRCGKGHIWRASGSSVVRAKTWCARCAYDSHKIGIEAMHKLAEARGGKCLSSKYEDATTKLKWQCAKGHIWETTPAIIRGGAWCIICTSLNLNSLDKLQAKAKEMGGVCLSEKYLGSAKKHLFRCEKGHEWWTHPSSLVGGHWCHACAGREHGSIEKMQKLAAKFGGKCLSTEYKNNKTKLLWECKNGHQFLAKPNHVISRGQWCKECRKLRNLEPDHFAADATLHARVLDVTVPGRTTWRERVNSQK